MRFEISEVLKQAQVMDLVYGNSDAPKKILGRHYVEEGQVLSAYHPEAVSMRLFDEAGMIYKMDAVERQPVFALFLPSQIPFSYRIEMTFRDGKKHIAYDPYSFSCQITQNEEDEFVRGTWKNSYKKLGCHPAIVEGVVGVYFAVWAPTARRVSVVGDFNYWNGMTHPMNRMERSGIFELFIPGIASDSFYKFEIKTWQGEFFRKMDPYGAFNEREHGNASRMFDLHTYLWDDIPWMRNKKYKTGKNHPFAIYDISLGELTLEESFFEEGYSHILLSDYVGRFDKKSEFANAGFYTPKYCGGDPGKMRKLIDHCHKKGMGVLMEISPGFFAKGESGLSAFDGSSLYGFADRRISIDEKRNMFRFSYEKKEVETYLLSNLIFWMKEYHIDGFVFEGISDILFPQEKKVANLDMRTRADVFMPEENAYQFLRICIERIREEDPDLILIADECTEMSWKMEDLCAEQLGFDYVWNYSIRCNLDTYLKKDMNSRIREHFRVTLPLQKPGLENSFLSLNQKSPLDKSPSYDYHKLSEMKMACGFSLGVPGEKVWVRNASDPAPFQEYLKSLLKIYRHYDCLYDYNPVEEPFTWSNALDATRSVVSFIRGGLPQKDRLLFVCNFGQEERSLYQVGVPKYGTYTLISNSDAKEFGGNSTFEEQQIISGQECFALKPYSIRVFLPASSTLIFKF